MQSFMDEEVTIGAEESEANRTFVDVRVLLRGETSDAGGAGI